MIRNRVDGFTNLNRNLRILPESPGFWNLNFHKYSYKSIYPYITNHVMCIALFGKQESLESSQESWNLAKIPNHVEENP